MRFEPRPQDDKALSSDSRWGHRQTHWNILVRILRGAALPGNGAPHPLDSRNWERFQKSCPLPFSRADLRRCHLTSQSPCPHRASASHPSPALSSLLVSPKLDFILSSLFPFLPSLPLWISLVIYTACSSCQGYSCLANAELC